MKRQVRWVFRCAALLGAALLIGAVADARAADTVRVGKAQGAAWDFVPADIGVQEGIFARYGLTVEIVDLGGDAKVQQALAADSIDFGLGSGPGMAFAVKGSPAIGVAAFAGAPLNISAIVLADSPIKTVAGLKGKLIAVSTVGSLSDWLAKQMAVQEGWGQDGIRTIPLGAIDASVSALKTRQVDAVVLATETGYLLAERGEGRILTGMEKYAPHFITHVVFAHPKMVQDNPDLVERFLKGFFAAIGFVKSHRNETNEVASRVLKESVALAGHAYDSEVSMLEDDGHFDPAAVAVLKASFVDMGVLTEKPADDQLFTTRFVPVKP